MCWYVCAFANVCSRLERCQVQLISSDVSAMVDREDSSSTVVWHRAVTVILRGRPVLSYYSMFGEVT